MGPFEFTKDIMFEKNYLMNDSWTEKQYNAFIVNRALSLFPDTIFFANEMNKSAVLDKKMQHDYLFYSIRKKRRFEKWPWKKTHVGDLELIQEVYKYPREKALQALKLLTSEQLTMIRKQQKEKGGIIYGGDTS